MPLKQLPSGKSSRALKPVPPTSAPHSRQIYTAGPVNADNIIDAELQSAPYEPVTSSPHAEATQRRTAYALPYREPYPDAGQSTTDPFEREPPAATRAADQAFPNGFVKKFVDYEEQRRPSPPWVFIITPLESNWFKITIIGSKWTLMLFAAALILVGFSIEKLPDFLPQLFDLIP